MWKIRPETGSDMVSEEITYLGAKKIPCHPIGIRCRVKDPSSTKAKLSWNPTMAVDDDGEE